MYSTPSTNGVGENILVTWGYIVDVDVDHSYQFVTKIRTNKTMNNIHRFDRYNNEMEIYNKEYAEYKSVSKRQKMENSLLKAKERVAQLETQLAANKE